MKMEQTECSETSAYKIQTPDTYLPMKMEQTECSETSVYKIQTPDTYLPMKIKQTECSETSAYKIQTPGIYPKESIQHSEHGESLKSSVPFVFIIRIMNQQMRIWSTVYCTALYYTAHTRFDAIASSSGSSQSVPAKLRIYVNTVLLIHFNTVFSIDNAHLMYNAHPKLFRHSFWCIDKAHDVFFDR